MKTELVFKRSLLEVSFFMEFYAMRKGEELRGNCGAAEGNRFYGNGEKQKIDKIRGICYTVYIIEKEAE